MREVRRLREAYGVTEVRARVEVPPEYLGMNKLERRFLDEQITPRILAGEWLRWRYEDIRLRIGDGAWYTPDFYTVDIAGRVHFHEIKGHMREAARVRLLSAVRQFREYGWHLWTYPDRQWKEVVL